MVSDAKQNLVRAGGIFDFAHVVAAATIKRKGMALVSEGQRWFDLAHGPEDRVSYSRQCL